MILPMTAIEQGVRRSMFRRIIMQSAIALGLAAGPMAAFTIPAHAWAWDSTVTLGGKAECNYSTSNTVRWAWVSGSDGESGWASLGSGGMDRPYSFTFHHVPSNGMTITVNWGCAIDGSHSTSFGLKRPTVGEGATRNVCYWTGCF
jgi:hypothetical protein